MYRAHSGMDEFLERNLHRNHFLPLSNNFLIPDFGVAFEVMHSHSRSMDRQIMQKSLFFSRYLPPSCFSALSSRMMNFSFYFAIVAPGIFPRAPLKSTPVRAWIAGGKVPINLFTSCVVLLPPPISTIWSVLARGADTSAAI